MINCASDSEKKKPKEDKKIILLEKDNFENSQKTSKSR
jgi:hypothetical protein